MKIASQFKELSSIHEPIHWAMGVFDGVHMGHRFVISSAKQVKADQGGLLGVLTFDRHPMHTVRPDDAPRQILSGKHEKQALLEEMGVDVLLNLHFDHAIAQMTAGEFLDALCSSSNVASISVGEDWRFGKGREGNASLLESEGKKRGFSVYVHPHVIWNGERISSTRIRQGIEHGRLDDVRAMLGRPCSVSGTVIAGRQLGRELGYPTANIRPLNEQLPPRGVYAVHITLQDGSSIGGIASLGIRPTLEDDSHTLLLEVHLFDWVGDLYGQNVTVEFLELIRPEMKFASLDELKLQISQDSEKARNILSLHQ